jgi:hypothetical protein
MGYLMFLLALVISYPLFMLTAYALAKVIFVKIEDEELELAEERHRSIVTKRYQHRHRGQLMSALKVKYS